LNSSTGDDMNEVKNEKDPHLKLQKVWNMKKNLFPENSKELSQSEDQSDNSSLTVNKVGIFTNIFSRILMYSLRQKLKAMIES